MKILFSIALGFIDSATGRTGAGSIVAMVR
jgi:hypothetical protein